jgi:y4mF family transcriptional regulator
MPTKQDNHIAHFVKYNRNKLGLTQEELAKKAGTGLRFIRELEQGKGSLRMDKVNQVLALFGSQLLPGSGRVKDPYEILLNHTTSNVHLYLKNKTVLVGFIMQPILDDKEIKAWKFLTNNKAIEYQKTKDAGLLMDINHADIENIENI